MKNSGFREKFLLKVFLDISSNKSFKLFSSISSLMNKILFHKISFISSSIISLLKENGKPLL